MDVTREGLLAAVGHLDGPARVEREQRGVDLDREILTSTERTAHTR